MKGLAHYNITKENITERGMDREYIEETILKNGIYDNWLNQTQIFLGWPGRRQHTLFIIINNYSKK